MQSVKKMLKWLFYAVSYLVALVSFGWNVGYWTEVFVNDYDPVADRNAYVADCVQQGEKYETCVDSFYGFPLVKRY